MRYSIFAGGKRIRPLLCMESAKACGGDEDDALNAACALETLHTYTLIHDDLPCMDNDDMRRGRPTNHKVFGEGVAVLAGDALLTEAFAILSRVPSNERYTVGDYVAEFAYRTGSLNLVGGQVLDLEGEGRELSVDELRAIHNGKTSALIMASTRLGGMVAGCTQGAAGRTHRLWSRPGTRFPDYRRHFGHHLLPGGARQEHRQGCRRAQGHLSRAGGHGAGPP